LNPDTQKPIIHAYLNPLVKCIWLGGAVVVLGTILALVPSQQATIVLRPVTQPVPLGATPEPAVADWRRYGRRT
jgi:hypothetical protein